VLDRATHPAKKINGQPPLAEVANVADKCYGASGDRPSVEGADNAAHHEGQQQRAESDVSPENAGSRN